MCLGGSELRVSWGFGEEVEVSAIEIDGNLSCEEFSFVCFSLQGGPLPVISRVITYNSIYPFIRPFIGIITPLITSRGPPCSW